MRTRYLMDGHVYADGLRDVDLETLTCFGVKQALLCAHDGGLARPGLPTARDWLNHFDRLIDVEVPRFKRLGLRPLVAMGISPHAAPSHGIEELLYKLPQYLSHPSVVAIGSLGVRSFAPQELHVLQRHLELAAELRRPVLVSGPVRGLDAGLRRLVSVLKATELPLDRVLIEQVNAASIPMLHASGFTIALEASGGRLSHREIVQSIRRFGAERLVLSSHAGEGSADLLAVPFLAAHLVDEHVPPGVISRVACENVLRFLGCDDSIRQARAG